MPPPASCPSARPYLRVGDGRQLLLLELLDGVLVLPEVELGAHQDDGRVWTVVAHLRVPLQRGNRTAPGAVSTGPLGTLQPCVHISNMAGGSKVYDCGSRGFD